MPTRSCSALDAAERAPDKPRPEDTAAFAAVSPEGETDLAEEEPPYEEWEPERRRRWRWIVVALLAAGVAALVAFALTRPSHVAIPDVIGQDVAAATQLLDRKGFDVDDQGRSQRSPDEPGGRAGPDSNRPRGRQGGGGLDRDPQRELGPADRGRPRGRLG